MSSRFLCQSYGSIIRNGLDVKLCLHVFDHVAAIAGDVGKDFGSRNPDIHVYLVMSDSLQLHHYPGLDAAAQSGVVVGRDHPGAFAGTVDRVFVFGNGGYSGVEETFETYVPEDDVRRGLDASGAHPAAFRFVVHLARRFRVLVRLRTVHGAHHAATEYGGYGQDDEGG